MIHIPKAETDYITTYAEDLLARCTPDMTAKDVLSKAFQELMGTGSVLQGRLAAEELLTQMAIFQACYELQLEEPAHGSRIILEHLLQGLPAEKQCQILHDFSEGLCSLAGTNAPDGMTGQPSEEVRERLMKETLSLLQLQEEGQLSDHGQLYFDLTGRVSKELSTALTAMILYCMAKKGELEGCPQEVTLKQIVTCVCQEMADQQTALVLQKEYIDGAEANDRRKAAKKTSLLLLLAASILSGVFTSLFSGSVLILTDVLRKAMASLKHTVPQTEEILQELAEEEDLHLSRVKLLEPYVIPVEEYQQSEIAEEDTSFDLIDETEEDTFTTEKEHLTLE
ncbi:MAG: hypothetical protein IKA89_07755 [Anaerotignum sp.]|nr:hypothetical protein [Anaerotignum sp.]